MNNKARFIILRKRQNGRHFKLTFLYENHWILFQISFKSFPKVPINNHKIQLVQIMVWCQAWLAANFIWTNDGTLYWGIYLWLSLHGSSMRPSQISKIYQNKSLQPMWTSQNTVIETFWKIVINTIKSSIPDSKFHEANMGPTWVLSAPDGPHVGHMNLAFRDFAAFILLFPAITRNGNVFMLMTFSSQAAPKLSVC